MAFKGKKRGKAGGKKGSKGSKKRKLNSWGERAAPHPKDNVVGGLRFLDPEEERLKKRKEEVSQHNSRDGDDVKRHGKRLNQYQQMKQRKLEERARRRQLETEMAFKRVVPKRQKPKFITAKMAKQARKEERERARRLEQRQAETDEELSDDSDEEKEGASAYDSLLSRLERPHRAVLSEDESDEFSEELEQEGGEEEEDEEEDEIALTKEEFEEYKRKHKGEFEIVEAPDEDEDGSEDEEEVADESSSLSGEDREEEEDKQGEAEDGRAREQFFASDDEDEDEAIEEEDEIEAGERGESEHKGSMFYQRYYKTTLTDEDAVNLGSQNRTRYAAAKTIDVSRAQGEKRRLELCSSSEEVLSHTSAELSDIDEQLRPKLAERWRQVSQGELSGLQKSLAPILFGYKDLLFCTEDDQCHKQELVTLMAAHVLNHVMNRRSIVMKNNQRLKELGEKKQLAKEKLKELATPKADKRKKKARDSESKEPVDPEIQKWKNVVDEEIECRDQGFTRPTVLVLLPLRSSAERFVQEMLRLLPASMKTVHHKDRFFEEFGTNLEDGEDDQARRKPESWRELFSGNNDDCFEIGVNLTKKGMKLYSRFINSDIIIASPLGLRMTIGGEGDAKREFDFLSSIDLLLMDQTDVFLMQNWSHVLDVMKVLNVIPKEANDTDFSRVQEYALSGHAKFYRQTLIFSRYQDPLINSLFQKWCQNVSGKVKVRCHYEGSMVNVIPKVRQVFQRIESNSLEDLGDDRFNYFKANVLEKLLQREEKHILIFVPSYFDFVRVRNLLMKKETSFVSCSEYTSAADVSRARTWFFHGKRDIMLCTGRFHFFRRYKIRGAHSVIFYSPPLYDYSYYEVLNGLEEADSVSVTSSSLVLYSKFDLLSLERIVGTTRAQRMLQSEKATFLFC